MSFTFGGNVWSIFVAGLPRYVSDSWGNPSCPTWQPYLSRMWTVGIEARPQQRKAYVLPTEVKVQQLSSFILKAQTPTILSTKVYIPVPNNPTYIQALKNEANVTIK